MSIYLPTSLNNLREANLFIGMMLRLVAKSSWTEVQYPGPSMSALGQKQTFAAQKAMSALPPIATEKADMLLVVEAHFGAVRQLAVSIFA